jgi:MFS family permease
VVKAPELRAMSFACFAFNGVQSVFTAYFVTYLAASGYELAAAGLLFSLVVVLAMPCRVLWGWLGSFFVAPHLVMAGLSFGMAAGMAFLGIIGPGWPTAALASAGAVVSATALSWHGILLSEAARLAPTGTIGSVTGGILSFGQIGALFGPILFSLLLGLTGGYAIGWAICAIPGLWVGFLMLRPAATKEQSVLLGK